jgi:hypothetical protein
MFQPYISDEERRAIKGLHKLIVDGNQKQINLFSDRKNTVDNSSEITMDKMLSIARRAFQRNQSYNSYIASAEDCSFAAGIYGASVAIRSSFYSWKIIGIVALAMIFFHKFSQVYNNRDQVLLLNILNYDIQERLEELAKGISIDRSIYRGVQVPSQPFTYYVTRKNFLVSLVFGLLLAKDINKRKKIASEALFHVEDVETARILIEAGATFDSCYKTKRFLTPLLFKKLDVVRYFCKNGLKLDKGVTNYIEWENKLSCGVDELGQMPLELLINKFKAEDECFEDPRLALETLLVPRSVYEGKNSAEELYRSLNEAGVRIRMEYLLPMYEKMYPAIETKTSTD